MTGIAKMLAIATVLFTLVATFDRGLIGETKVPMQELELKV